MGQIDPDNAHYWLWLAGQTAELAVQKEKIEAVDNEQEKQKVIYHIKDQSAYDQAFEYLERALKLGKNLDYSTGITAKRVFQHPAPAFFEDRIPIIVSSFSVGSGGLLKYRNIVMLLEVQFEKTVHEGTAEDSLKALDSAERFIQLITQMEPSYLQSLISVRSVMSLSEAMIPLARKLNDQELLRKIQTRHKNITRLQETKLRSSKSRRDPDYESFTKHLTQPYSEKFAGMFTVDKFKLRPNYSDEELLADLEPGRNAEFAFINGFLSKVAALFSLCLATILIGISWFSPPSIRRLSAYLRGSLKWQDWGLICLWAIVLPFGVLWITTLLTTWIGGGKSYKAIGANPHLAAYSAAFISVICGALGALRWRLGRWLQFPGGVLATPRIWLPYILALVCIPMSFLPYDFILKIYDIPMIVVTTSLGALGLLWGLFQSIRNHTQKRKVPAIVQIWPYTVCLFAIVVLTIDDVWQSGIPFGFVQSILSGIILWALIPGRGGHKAITVLHRQNILTCLIPILLCLSAFLSLLITPLLEQREKHWVSQDTFLKVYKDPLALKLEHIITKELSKQIKEIVTETN